MKKIIISSLAVAVLATYAQAKENTIDKVMRCYTAFTNGTVEFKAKKSGDGYDVLLQPKNRVYKRLLKQNAKIHLKVDEGPIITAPSFSLGKAGISANGDIFSILNPKITEQAAKNFKTKPEYSYKAKISFGGELESDTVIKALKIDNSDISIATSDIILNSDIDTDTCLNQSEGKIDFIKIKPKKDTGGIIIKNLEFNNKITGKLIDNLALFGKGNLTVKEFILNAKERGKKLHSKMSVSANYDSKMLNDKYMAASVTLNAKALDAKTIALAKGIKSSSVSYSLENMKIKGIVDFVNFSKKLNQIQEQIDEARAKDDDIKLQKAIFEMSELSNTKLVPIYNEIFIKDKTRFKLNISLNGEKTSYIKLNLLYKAEPVRDNMQSAMITLAAQNLAIADGDFDVKLDSSLASDINPLSIMVLDMLKQKGFATLKNGVYHIKGELKGGKIVINGKTYTLAELSRLMF